MNKPTELNDREIKRATDRNFFEVRDRLKAAAKCDKDSEKNRRLDEGKCRACYYFRGGIVGHGFTTYTCLNCKEEHTHATTGVPLLCSGAGGCGPELGLCRWCLGRLDEKL